MGCLFSFLHPRIEEITIEEVHYYYDEPLIKKQLSDDTYSNISSYSPPTYYDAVFFDKFSRFTSD